MRSTVLVAAAAVVAGVGGSAVAETGPATGVRRAAGHVVIAGPNIGAPPGGYDFKHPQVIATGIDVPWGIDFLPDGSGLVAERNTGRILRVRLGQAPVEVARIPDVWAVGEAGLLGLAVSPRYRRDGYVYAYYTTAVDNRIVRFRLGAQPPEPIVTGLAKASFHDGGRLAFGPDGLLYAGTGDAGQPAAAQDPTSRTGKILRLRPDGTAPPGNPFPGSIVYSIGHRNVQGLAFDRSGRLYATELGAGTADEVNLIVRAGNYGWPVVEGRAGDPRFRDPLVTWTPAEASPSGAAIAGRTLYVAALRGQRLWTVPLTGAGAVGTPVPQLVGSYGRLRTVAVAPDGALWVSTSNRDGRITPRHGDDRIVRFPRLRSCPVGC